MSHWLLLGPILSFSKAKRAWCGHFFMNNNNVQEGQNEPSPTGCPLKWHHFRGQKQ